MGCQLVLNLDNSITLEIILTNPKVDPIYVNDSTVTALIKDSTGAIIKASFALPYVAASNGIYRETITPVAALVEGQLYTVEIDATGSDGIIGHWENIIKATIAK